LSQDISKKVDALIIASNALNDADIRHALCNTEFKLSLTEFLKSGKGCLIFQQFRLGQ